MSEINNSNNQCQEVIVTVLRNRLKDILRQEKTNLTKDEYEMLKKYQKRVVKLFRKSIEFSDLIAKTYSIEEIGEPKVVWSNKTGNKIETIDSKGVWRANYLKEPYCEVECSLGGIFNLLNVELLVAEHLVEEDEMEICKKKVKLAKDFHNFIDHTLKLASGQESPR